MLAMLSSEEIFCGPMMCASVLSHWRIEASRSYKRANSFGKFLI